MADNNEIIQTDESIQQLKVVTDSNFDMYLKRLGLPAEMCSQVMMKSR